MQLLSARRFTSNELKTGDPSANAKYRTHFYYNCTLAVLVLVIIIILRACINWSPEKEQHKVEQNARVHKEVGIP